MQLSKQEIYTPGSLHSGALYSQAIRTGDLLFVAGQVPLDPITKRVAEGGVYEQSIAVLGYIQAILEAAGSGMDDIVKMNCYLTDIGQFPEMNRAFERFFDRPYPARTTVGVQLIGFMVEMDCIAMIGSSSGASVFPRENG